MTREQFIKKWNKYIAGLALYGTISERNDGPLTRAAKIMDIPAEVEALLGRLYDSARESDTPPKAAANGKPTEKAYGEVTNRT